MTKKTTTTCNQCGETWTVFEADDPLYGYTLKLPGSTHRPNHIVDLCSPKCVHDYVINQIMVVPEGENLIKENKRLKEENKQLRKFLAPLEDTWKGPENDDLMKDTDAPTE